MINRHISFKPINRHKFMLCLLFLSILTASLSYAGLGDFIKVLKPEKETEKTKKEENKKEVSEMETKKKQEENKQAEAEAEFAKHIWPPDIKNLIVIRNSADSLRNEVMKVEESDMMRAKKDKQLEQLNEKAKILKQEYESQMKKLSSGNLPITLKGIEVNDMLKIRDNYYLTHSPAKTPCTFCGDDGYYLGQYSGYEYATAIISTKEFADKADRGKYDIVGTIVDFKEPYHHFFLMIIQLKSAKAVK